MHISRNSSSSNNNNNTNSERTKVLVWYLCYLFVSKSSCLVEASAGAGTRGSSFFGILGNAICGHDANGSDYERCDLPRSSPYVRLGRWSVSRGGSNNEPTLDDWTTTKSSSGEISIGSRPSTSTSSSDRHAAKSETPMDMLVGQHRTKKNLQPSPVAFRRRRRRRGSGRRIHNGEEGSSVTTCLPASLSTLSPSQDTDLTALTSPIVPLGVDINVQNGDEFSDPKALDLLVASGLELASTRENDWIEWKTHGSTRKLLEQKGDLQLLEEGEVLVYVGKAKKEGHGSNLPIIKTRSLLPISAEEMADLLMDSSKVKIYNKLSVGRTDLRTLGEGTKVVCNLTKPPIAKSNMVSCTLMHSRRLESSEGGAGGVSPHSYVVVSRAVPGMVEDHLSELPRNDILLGVNVLEDRGPNECLMTAVTHVYSPALPTMLAKKMGVGSAINFVKDVRNSCIGVGN